MHRRTLLAGVSFALSAAVAGCVGANAPGASTPLDAVEMYFGALETDDRETANQYVHDDGVYVVRDTPSNHAHVRALQDAETISIVELSHIDRETAARKMWYQTLSQGDPVADPDGPEDISDDRVNSTVEKAQATVNGPLQDAYDFDEHAHVWYEVKVDGDETLGTPVLLLHIKDTWLLWSPWPEIPWF